MNKLLEYDGQALVFTILYFIVAYAYILYIELADIRLLHSVIFYVPQTEAYVLFFLFFILPFTAFLLLKKKSAITVLKYALLVHVVVSVVVSAPLTVLGIQQQAEINNLEQYEINVLASTVDIQRNNSEVTNIVIEFEIEDPKIREYNVRIIGLYDKFLIVRDYAHQAHKPHAFSYNIEFPIKLEVNQPYTFSTADLDIQIALGTRYSVPDRIDTYCRWVLFCPTGMFSGRGNPYTTNTLWSERTHILQIDLSEENISITR